MSSNIERDIEKYSRELIVLEEDLVTLQEDVDFYQAQVVAEPSNLLLQRRLKQAQEERNEMKTLVEEMKENKTEATKK